MIDKSQKVLSFQERLKSIERLSEVPPFLEELNNWSSDNSWHQVTIDELSKLIDLIEAIIKELEDGS